MKAKTSKPIFPFSAIVGQEALKLALLLNIIDATIGGVLAIGDKGTGKTTLIRSLASLMSQQGDFPFVNLPIGVSEDRVLGHINLEKLINDKKEVVEKGLLAKANQGVLYIDEINLLNDYLMDVLLDASTTGQYFLEREGISTSFESQFCMVASMNPEEGHLRPQLKDRFGLSVNSTTPTDINIRTQIVQNRLSFDDAPKQFCERFESKEAQLLDSVLDAKRRCTDLTISPQIVTYCTELAAKHDVEGMRADILLIKTARAYAAYQEDREISTTHVDFIAPFVLGHRSNQQQQTRPQQEEAQEQQNSAAQENQNEAQSSSHHDVFDSVLPEHEINAWPKWKRDSAKGQALNHSKTEKKSIPNPNGTRKDLDLRQTVGQYQATNQFELKHKKSQNKSTRHLIFLLDSSGSMAKDQVIAYSKGLVEKIIEKHAFDRLIFSLLTVFDGDVHAIVEQCDDATQVTNGLKEVKTGGKTNIIAALKRVKDLIDHKLDAVNELMIITDGKFNTTDDEDEATVFHTYCKGIDQTTVVDAEVGVVKLNLTKPFAERIRANYESLVVSDQTSTGIK